ncbi:MAG: anhydro-N-acetylmuramic acid kinase [Schleiferiaceae bacterium]|nr:anhydro-N-acetylmuramic acid kinase [Schleiferiaceae bacterium]
MQMYNASFNVLGLMSGTSLDGMDAAVVQFSNVTDPHWKLLYFKCLPYPEALKKQIEAAYENASQSSKASAAFAQWSIDVIQAVQADFDGTIDLVASHGQTIFHKPEKKFTYQAGCLPEIATATKLPLVTNFRVQDVLLGGQGAPLVPFGDHKLFGTYEAALNLGGFANCSIGSPLLKDGVSVAFDICPANRILNTFARELGQDYDKDGLLARQGRINPWVLDQLNSLPFYDLPAPKSLGQEWIDKTFIELVDILAPKDALATCIQHIADQIAQQLEGKRTLVTGGGAFNRTLLQAIEENNVPIVLPEKTIIEAKEAIVFALLGFERFMGRANVIGTTTGSGIWHSSGTIFHP